MARHRNDETRRRVSRAPVLAVVAVVLVVLGTIGWFQVRSSGDDASNAAAAQCLDGTSTLAVAAAPEVAPVLTTLAAAYTERRTVVRDQCVEVTVTAVDPAAALAGLAGTWDEAADGRKPALWVPTDTSYATRAQALQPSVVTGTPRSLATSPVLLAVPAAAGPAVADAGLTWADVADRQGSTAWADLGQPGWGTFTQAVPAAGALTPLLAQAVAAGDGAGPVTTEQVSAAAGPLAALGGAPAPADTAAALDALTGLTEVAGSEYQAVAATEQQLLATTPGATPLAGVALAGATPTADLPLAQLTGSWVDETQSRAAGAFAEELEGPDAQAALAAAGFRTADAAPDAPAGTVLGTPGQALAPADAATTEAALTAVTTPPATTATTTVLLDVAAPGPTTTARLAATADALAARVQALPDAAGTGLWAYARNLDGDLPTRVDVATGPVGEAVDGTPRRALLVGALDALQPATGTSTYFALQQAYPAAVAGYVAGRTNSVLLVVDGANDGTTSSADALATIRAAGDPARPVRVDVVVLGPAFDTTGLGEITQATGGELVTAGDTAALSAALERLLV